MKGILIFLAIVAIAIFTGSWALDLVAYVFEFIAKVFRFLSEILNIFGWNQGIF